MRWHEVRIESGATRQRTYFAILPQVVEREWRWLEWVTVEERAWRHEFKDTLYWFRVKYVDAP